MTSSPYGFGPTVKLIGGNGQTGDFASSAGGLPETLPFNIATAVIPLATDEIVFLEGSQGRVGLWSKVIPRIVSPSYTVPGYRIPNLIARDLRLVSAMVGYKDGFLLSLPFANQLVFMKSDGTMTPFAGNGTAGMLGDGGPALQASFNAPNGLAVDANGAVYVADTNNQVIRRIDPNGKISTVGGQLGQAAEPKVFTTGGLQLNFPKFVTVDRLGRLYVYDSRNQIRRMAANGNWDVVAGFGTYEQDSSSVSKPGVGLGRLTMMTIGPDGWLYYGDETNHAIKRLDIGLPYEALRSQVVVGSGKDNGFPYYEDAPVKCTVGSPSCFGFKADGGFVYFEGSTFRWLEIPSAQ